MNYTLDVYESLLKTTTRITSDAEQLVHSHPLMTQILVTVWLGTVVLLVLVCRVSAIRFFWGRQRPSSSQKAAAGVEQKEAQPSLSPSRSIQDLAGPWWDDLAPPFSLESMETIAEDADLQRYNEMPVDIMHFCFLLHGIRGYSRDLSYLQTVMEIFVDKEKRKLCEASKTDPSVEHQDMLVHATVCNEGKTTDGVVNGGNRVVEEMYGVMRTWIEQQPRPPKEITLSVVGNSLGGVYARYALMRLAQDGMQVSLSVPGDDNGNNLNNLTFQFNIFCTTATPHLGVSRHTYMPLPRTAELGVARTMGETGSDLFLVTDLMKRMALEESYLGPLRRFRKRMALANAYGTDFPVPVATAAFLSDQSDYPHFFETSTMEAPASDTEDEEDRNDSEATSNSSSTDSSTHSRNYVIATLHTPPKMASTTRTPVTTDDDASDETTSTTTSSKSSSDTASSVDADLAEMSRSLDSLGWKKVFVDIRNEIPMGIKLPSFVRSPITSSLSMAASSFGASTPTPADEATRSPSFEESTSVPPVGTTTTITSEEETVMATLKQKGVVESREFKQAISASVPISRDGKLSIPLGHNMIVAFSRSRLATLMNKGGRPVVDGLAKELVEDVFSWNNSNDDTMLYASSTARRR